MSVREVFYYLGNRKEGSPASNTKMLQQNTGRLNDGLEATGSIKKPAPEVQGWALITSSVRADRYGLDVSEQPSCLVWLPIL